MDDLLDPFQAFFTWLETAAVATYETLNPGLGDAVGALSGGGDSVGGSGGGSNGGNGGVPEWEIWAVGIAVLVGLFLIVALLHEVSA